MGCYRGVMGCHITPREVLWAVICCPAPRSLTGPLPSPSSASINVKGQNDNDLQDVTGRHPVSFPHSNYHSLYDILHTFHTHLSSQAADREYFFSISQPCASANNAWLLTALSHVQATPPAGFRFVPKSCRSLSLTLFLLLSLFNPQEV